MRLVRLLTAIAALLLAAVFLSGCGEEQARADTPRRETTTVSTPPAKADPWNVTPTQPVYHPTPVTLQAPDPARIDIPAVGIASDLVPLGFNADGSMQVPKRFAEAGWFADGPNPGETGPAVIAGHVDSTRGPAVFYRLKDLQAGNDIVVTRVDGTTANFRVTARRDVREAGVPDHGGVWPDAERRAAPRHLRRRLRLVEAQLQVERCRLRDAQLNRPRLRRRVDNTVTQANCPSGPVAQWSEQGTHNPSVDGSIPSGPTSKPPGQRPCFAIVPVRLTSLTIPCDNPSGASLLSPSLSRSEGQERASVGELLQAASPPSDMHLYPRE